MYVFGGKDFENNKLFDLWVFDIPTLTWAEIKAYPQPTVSFDLNFSQPRSGHSAVVYKNQIYIFGGIFEITKELNDLWTYDI